jgi:hypothetical protein
MKTKNKLARKRTGAASSQPESHRNIQRAIVRGYERLVAAMVVQAVEDYRLFEEYKLVSGGQVTAKGKRSPLRKDILVLIKFLRGRALGQLLEVGVFSPEQELALRELGVEIYEGPTPPDHQAFPAHD